MKLEAINNYIVCDKVELEDQKLGDIFIPSTQEKNVRWHEVTSVGPGAIDFNGNFVPSELEVKDLVYIQNHGQFEIEGVYFNGPNCVVASINDVLVRYRNNEMRPLGNLVEIERIEQEEQEEGGIFMTKTFKYPSNVGRVVCLGEGWRTPTGGNIPFSVKVGDIVVYNPFAERTIEMAPIAEGKRYLISQGDIFAIAKESE